MEIQRLLDMGVLRNPIAEEIQDGTLLTTRLVHDSRVRNDGSHEPDMWPESLKFNAEEIQQILPQQKKLDHAWWSCCTSVSIGLHLSST